MRATARPRPYYPVVDLLARLSQAAPDVFESEPVTFAYLFGSHATGKARPGSDIDIAVYVDEATPEETYLDLSLRLARRLVSAAGVGPVEAVVVLNEAPLPLAGRIRRQRHIVYSRDEPARVRYESRIARLFNDFELHAAERDRARLKAIAEGRR